MPNILTPGQGLIFMKVGLHAREPIDEILARKRHEYDQAGAIFWGYGGNTCHPFQMVQPFAKTHVTAGRDIFLMMHKMDSNHFAEPKLAQEYTDDGVHWQPIPKGIEVRGSRYAMVLGQLQIDEFDLDLNRVMVAIGRSRGKVGTDYIKGHVDKGCFEYSDAAPTKHRNDKKRINLYAKLKSPYAVALR